MSNSHSHLVVFFVALATLSLATSFELTPGYGQSREDGKSVRRGTGGSKVRRTSSVREKPVEASSDSSPASSLRLVATRNASLRRELGWTFGGKEQRGWQIYEPLIGRLLQTEHDAASEGFAAALIQLAEAVWLESQRRS